jgi:hypothetical protein
VLPPVCRQTGLREPSGPSTLKNANSSVLYFPSLDFALKEASGHHDDPDPGMETEAATDKLGSVPLAMLQRNRGRPRLRPPLSRTRQGERIRRLIPTAATSLIKGSFSPDQGNPMGFLLFPVIATSG